VANVNIETLETLDDLKQVLKENGYSEKAVSEIIKWYEQHPC
jgi:predicted Ser/Thr protein kinase